MKTLATTICLLFVAAISLAANRPAPPTTDVTFTGTVTAWSVSSGGTVALKLEGNQNDESFALWFATPADRNATTRFEELVLDAVLSLSSDQDVTVTGEAGSSRTGKALDEAIDLIRLQKE